MPGPLVQVPDSLQGRHRSQSHGVIGRLRRKLREIDYHSARRQVDRWSRASDIWLIASFPLAICVAALLAWVVQVDERRVIALGALERGVGGTLTATFVAPNEQFVPRGKFLAGLEISGRRESGGWPLTLWVYEHPPVVLISDAATTRTIDFDQDAEASIVSTGIRRLEAGLLRRITEPATTRTHYGALSGIIAVAWLALVPLGLLAIQVARLGSAWMVARSKRLEHARRKRGLCPRCGYITKGLEWVAVCPECGETLD